MCCFLSNQKAFLNKTFFFLIKQDKKRWLPVTKSLINADNTSENRNLFCGGSMTQHLSTNGQEVFIGKLTADKWQFFFVFFYKN